MFYVETYGTYKTCTISNKNLYIFQHSSEKQLLHVSYIMQFSIMLQHLFSHEDNIKLHHRTRENMQKQNIQDFSPNGLFIWMTYLFMYGCKLLATVMSKLCFFTTKMYVIYQCIIPRRKPLETNS